MSSSTLDYIKVLEWLGSNIAWELVLIIFIILFPSLFSAIKISKFLLKQNRNTLGNAWGTHLADRFIDAWYSKAALDSEHTFYKRPGYQNSRWYIYVIDNELQKKKLVTINNNKISPIRNFRNKVIIKILKFYLIFFIGDNKKYYQDIKK